MKEFNRVFYSTEPTGGQPDPDYVQFQKEQLWKKQKEHRISTDPGFAALYEAGLIEQARKDFPAVADNLDVLSQIAMKEYRRNEIKPEVKPEVKPEGTPEKKSSAPDLKDALLNDLPGNPSASPTATDDKIDWDNFDVHKLTNATLADKLALKMITNSNVLRSTQIRGL